MSEEKDKISFKIDEKILDEAFKRAAKENEAWRNDSKRKDYKPEEMEIDVGDFYFLTDESDVEAYKKSNFPIIKSKHRRNYYIKPKD